MRRYQFELNSGELNTQRERQRERERENVAINLEEAHNRFWSPVTSAGGPYLAMMESALHSTDCQLRHCSAEDNSGLAA